MSPPCDSPTIHCDIRFYGSGSIFFSWQGCCDVILMKSPMFGNIEPELSVYIRTKRQRKWFIIDDVGIQVGKDILEIDGDAKLHKNREEVDTIEPKLYSSTKSQIVFYTFDFGNGRKLEVKANTIQPCCSQICLETSPIEHWDYSGPFIKQECLQGTNQISRQRVWALSWRVGR